MLTSSVFGQKKNSLTVSVIADNYVGLKYQNYNSPNYNYNRLFGPGVELIYLREIFKGLDIGTGINYQSGFMASRRNTEYFQYRRFHFNDIGFPILLKKYFKIRDYDKLYLTTGIYFGKTTKIKAEYATRGPWYEFPEISTLENYSDDISYSDLYFDFGYHASLNKLFTYSFSPFFKYRINTTWLNYYQKNYHFGLKLNFTLNY